MSKNDDKIKILEVELNSHQSNRDNIYRLFFEKKELCYSQHLVILDEKISKLQMEILNLKSAN